MKIELDERETATVIAALFYWLRKGGEDRGAHEWVIASSDHSITPLSVAETSNLCLKVHAAELVGERHVEDGFVGGKEVTCVGCKSKYICTPTNDYYNNTNAEDGVCGRCLVNEGGPKGAVDPRLKG